MASLLDIAPAGRTVPVRGTDVAVTGVSAAALVGLLRRFPTLLTAFAGGSLTADAIADAAPDAIAAILAAGTGSSGDQAAETAAAGLAVGDQLSLLSAVVEETLPDGVEGFTQRLEGLVAAAGARGADPKAGY